MSDSVAGTVPLGPPGTSVFHANASWLCALKRSGTTFFANAISSALRSAVGVRPNASKPRAISEP